MSACFPCRQKIRGIVTGAKGIPDPTAPQSLPDMKWWCTTSETRQKKAQQKFEVEMEGSCAPEQLLDFIPGGGGAVEALIRGASTDSMADAGTALNLVQQMFEQEPSSSSAMLSKCCLAIVASFVKVRHRMFALLLCRCRRSQGQGAAQDQSEGQGQEEGPPGDPSGHQARGDPVHSGPGREAACSGLVCVRWGHVC